MTDPVGRWPHHLVVVIESKEHYGWPPTEYRVVGMHPGDILSSEFLQVRKLDGEGLSLYLRPRFGPPDWREIAEDSASVAAWSGEPLSDGRRFAPGTANPDSWVDIRRASGARLEDELSAALLAFLGRGRSAAPVRDTEACRSSAVDSNPDELLARVVAVVEDAATTPIDWTDTSLPEGGRPVAERVAARQPQLSDDAVPPWPGASPLTGAEDTDAARVEALLGALGKLPPHRGVSYRGQAAGASFGRTQGNVVVTRLLTASSRDVRVATENFRAAGRFVILGRTGRVIEHLSRHPEEREVVFLPSSMFMVVKQALLGGMPVTIVEQLNPERGTPDDPLATLDEVAALATRRVRAARSAPPVALTSPGKFTGDIE